MIANDLQDNLNWLIIRSSMRAKQPLMKLSDDYDLSPQQGLTICGLEPGKAVPMSYISEFLGCDPSNVTGIVERLHKSQYIDRQESLVDRRVKTISLTPKGVELRKKLLLGIVEEDKPALVNLTKAEISMLKQLISKTLPTLDTK